MSAHGSETPEARVEDDTRPWKSGRVLTAEQRRRKREVNRNTARSTKQDLQQRVSQLEAQVSEFEQWKKEILLATSAASPALEVTSAPSHAPQSSKPSATSPLAGLPAAQAPLSVNLGYIPTAHDQSNQASPIEQVPRPSDAAVELWPSPVGGFEELFNSHQSLHSTEHNELKNVTGLEDELSNVETLESLPAQGNVETSKPQYEITPALRTSSLSPHGRDVTTFLNSATRYVRSLPVESLCLDDARNQDVVIRAVLQGWDRALEQQINHCPLWDCLRHVDNVLFRNCSVIDRIALLRAIHLKCLSEQTSGTPKAQSIPPWYMPLPSQTQFKHDPMIDYFAWPGLRDKLTICENNTLTNKFWAIFVREFRFAWPFEPLEAIQYSHLTGQYCMSISYTQLLADICSWRMNVRFCANFQQFALDIVPADYMPLTNMPADSLTANARPPLPPFEEDEQQRQQHHSIVAKDY